MKNKIEIKNNIVHKTYTSRLDYVKEENLYKKLSGSGLAPELLASQDGYLEHEYVEGDSFLDLLLASQEDKAKLEEYIKKFCIWYEKYRELTKLTLGEVRFDKFILSGDRLINLDFEHSKPGYLEDDFARLVAQMLISGEAFAESNINAAKFFIYVASKTVSWIPEIFSNSLSKAIIAECKKQKVLVNEPKMEMLITFLTSAGIVFAGSEGTSVECSKDINLLPERYVVLHKGKAPSSILLDDFVKISISGGTDSVLQRLVEAQANVTQMWTICVTADMPRIPQIMWQALLSAEKKDYAAVMVEAGGKLREFPLLLNTAKTRLELEHAYKKGATSLTDVLSSMPINVLKIEDIR